MQTVSDAPSIVGPGHNLATTTDILADRFKSLLDEVEDLAKRANAAKDDLGTPPEVKTDAQRDSLIALGVEAHKLIRRLEDTKLDTTKPLRDEVTETNKFFQTITVRPENIKAAFSRIAGDYDAKKREESRRLAAEEAELAAAEAKRKLEEAAATTHGVLSDVVLQEAEQAEHKAQVLANQALATGSGPTRTDAGTISQRKVWSFRITDASKIDLNKLRPHFGIDDIEKAIRAHVKANRDTSPLSGVEIFPDTKAQFRG